MKINIAASLPNNSIPIKVHAIGELVEPEKTATNPIPAKKPMGSGINELNELPKVAPIKNKGVTSPPLKPALNVKTVKPNFNAKTSNPCLLEKDATIVSSPSPAYLNPRK